MQLNEGLANAAVLTRVPSSLPRGILGEGELLLVGEFFLVGLLSTCRHTKRICSVCWSRSLKAATGDERTKSVQGGTTCARGGTHCGSGNRIYAPSLRWPQTSPSAARAQVSQETMQAFTVRVTH